MTDSNTDVPAVLLQLEESASTLANDLPGRLKDTASEDASSVVAELVALAAELRSLTSCIKADPKSDSNHHDSFPILEGCHSMLKTTSEDAANMSVEPLRDLAALMRWHSTMLRSTLRPGRSAKDVLLHLSLLRSQPSFGIHEFRAILEADKMAVTVDLSPDNGDFSAQAISSCLDVFLHPSNGHEPHEFHLEQSIGRKRAQEYSKSATLWPRYAERYWDELKPKIMALVSPGRRNNFVRWLLEYVKTMFPKAYTDGESGAGLLVALTEASYSGTLLPIHVAAALGLPTLCSELMSVRFDAQQAGPLGTPLVCAMLGANVFVPLASGETWLQRDNVDKAEGCTGALEDRSKTIHFFIEATATAMSQQSWGDLPDPISLSSLAFWASFRTRHDSILRATLKWVDVFEEDIEDTVQHSEFMSEIDRAGDDPVDEKLIMPSLLTCLVDHQMRLAVTDEDEDDPGPSFVEDLMLEYDIKFDSSIGLEIQNLSEEGLYHLVTLSIIEGESFRVGRVLADPRFDPTRCFPVDEGARDPTETFLHVAVSGDHATIVEMLVDGGASLEARDSEGRTPLMLAEGIQMLSMLINIYHASTTATDKKGRTIWHMFAATNDDTLLEWLFSHDPAKAENLTAVSNEGFTPLGEALRYAEQLSRQPSSWTKPKADAAFSLLGECIRSVEREGIDDLKLIRKRYLTNTQPITHLAAVWGDLDMLQSLELLGADFTELGKGDRSVLHYVNFSASEEFVKYLKKAAGDVPVASKDGCTPAEAIFINVELTWFNGSQGKSSHPSCWGELSREAFQALLTPEVLEYRKGNGAGLWQRFSDAVIIGEMFDVHGWKPSALSSMECSIDTALRAMIRSGALRKYEEETGVPAISAFLVTTNLSDSVYSMRFLHRFVGTILECSDEKSLELFKAWPESSVVALGAVIHDDARLLANLRKLGLKVYRNLGIIMEGESPAEYALRCDYPLSFLKTVLDHTPLDELNDENEDLIEHILCYAAYKDEAEEERSLERLNLLLEYGLHVDSVCSDGPMVCAAIKRSLNKIATALIEAGADLNLDEYEYGPNAVVTAIKECNLPILSSLIDAVDDDFSWDGPVWNSVERCKQNLLQMAVSFADPVIVQLLLDRCPDVVMLLDDASNGSAAVHEAVRRNSVDLLRVLGSNGANMKTRGTGDKKAPDDFTPLHLAVFRGCSSKVFKYLLEAEPDGVHEKDSQGKTPLDWAKSRDAGRIIKILENGSD